MANIKSADQVKSDLENVYKSLDNKLDITSNKVERDLLIEAPVDGAISNLWSTLSGVSKAQSIQNANSISTDDMDLLASNFNIIRNTATFAEGSIFFYSNIAPISDITISSGIIITTNDINPVRFVTTESKVMYAATPNIYYIPSLNLWGIELKIQCSAAGISGNKNAGLITILNSPITGITSVNNIVATTGGSDSETNTSLANRISARFEGEDLSTIGGLRTFIKSLNNVIDTFVVGPNNSYMLRDEGNGGDVDIYILGSTTATHTDTFTGSSTGYYVMTYQPVISVSSLVGVSTYTEGIDFTFVKDTGVFAGSTSGLDKIIFTTTGLIGQDLTLTYTTNSLIGTIQNLFTIDAHDIVNSDVLIKETEQVTINIVITNLILSSGFDETATKNSIQTALSNLINIMGLGITVELADVIGTIKSTAGVDNINILATTITPVGGGTISPQGDILLNAKEYPRIGTITYA